MKSFFVAVFQESIYTLWEGLKNLDGPKILTMFYSQIFQTKKFYSNIRAEKSS